MSFKQYHFQPFIETALDKLNFTEPTAIQQAVIPVIQAGKNLVAQSQTGSGKSHAFLLPLINQLTAAPRTQLVITAPSRELAEQLYQTAHQLLAESPDEIYIERAFGGTDTSRQNERLANKPPQVVVGTPGRILDLVNRQVLDLHLVTDFVVDEADMTLDMGFITTVDQIAGRMPQDLRMYVFSATIPEKLQPFLKKYMASPEWIKLESKRQISDTIQNILLPLRGRNRNALLYQTLTIGQPYLALIFANTIETVEKVYHYLKDQGLAVAMIHGDLEARDRRRTMKKVKNLEYQYVVATDLAARGIDIEGVSHVINYEIPNELEFFIHRVGRTGRNGLPGTAVTFFHPDQQPAIEWLEKKGIQFETKDIKDGEFVDTTDHKQRQQRRKDHEPDVDHTVKGMIDRTKKTTVKPGYKKKLQRDIKDYKRAKYSQEQRQAMRQQRKKNKEDNRVEY